MTILANAAQANFNSPIKGAYTNMDELLKLRFVAGDLNVSPRQTSRSQISGAFKTRFRGRGMEFEEVRHYQPGDDIRSIDWRVTARTQVTHTKLFTEERERPVILMVDQRPSLFFGSQTCFKSVLAAHCAAALGWAALANNDRIGGLVFNDTMERDLRPKRSRHALLSLLQEIHKFNHQLTSPIGGTDNKDGPIHLSQRLHDLKRIARPGSAVVIISDFAQYDKDCEERLYQLARHCEVSLVHVSDPLEQELPENRLLSISNGRQKKLLDSANQQTRNDYELNFKTHTEAIAQSASRLNLPLLFISTELGAFPQLQSLFGKSAIKRDQR
jgi:uncharacterized protein (DUF58 family)